MKIGIVASRFDQYPYTRNIIGIVPEAEYIRVKDLYTYLNVAFRRWQHLTHRQFVSISDLNNQFYDANLNKVDLLHFFNGVNYGHTPWVSTFETVLPRFQDTLSRHEIGTSSADKSARGKTRRAFEALAGDSCKRLIALSECSAAMQRNLLSYFDGYQAIEKKLVVMQPPQPPLLSSFSEKNIDLDGSIRFLLIASSFFRKGGREILETFKILRDKYHYDIKLTIVSPLRSFDSYAVQEGTDDIHWAETMVRENADWIQHFPRLPNPDVLALMKQSHIGLLPTYADSYGYSVLEMQAAGCPVITTNVRALPEFNNDAIGWLIDVPKDSLGEAIFTTAEGRQAISAAIRQGLTQAVHEIFGDRSLVPAKAEKAIASIKNDHSVMDFAAGMRKIYQEALTP